MDATDRQSAERPVLRLLDKHDSENGGMNIPYPESKTQACSVLESSGCWVVMS